MKKHRVKWLLALGLAVITVLTLIPFFGIGFATDDDFQYFITARQSWQRWLYDAKVYAIGAGRFYFLITKYFYYVPYLVDSFVYTKVVQYVLLTSCYFVFVYLVYRLFHSQRLALLTLLLIVFNTAVTPQDYFIPNINYPFYFSFSSIVFMLAVIVWLDYTEKGGYWRVVVSALLCLVAYLFYETYLLFSIVFFAAIGIRQWRLRGFGTMWRQRDFWREVLPFASAAVIYLLCYVGYRGYVRAVYPEFSFYDGARFDATRFSLGNFFRVCERCTRIALPCQTYFYNKRLISENSLLLGGHRRGLFHIFMQASVVVWINAVLQTALLWSLSGGKTLTRLSWRRIIVGGVVALGVAFFAHTLIAITPKYNIEWAEWIRGYVTSFYSLLALMLVFALAVAASLKAVRSGGWHRFIRILWCVVFFSLSMVMGYSNQHIGREWKKSRNRLVAIDKMADMGFFDTLPDNALLYTRSLHNTPGIGFGPDVSQRDMEGYINLRAGRNFYALTDWTDIERYKAKDPDAPVFFFHAVAAQKTGDIVIAVSQIDEGSLSDTVALTTSRTDVFYLSPAKRYTVFYRAADGLCSESFDAGNTRQRLTHLELQAAGIVPTSILISNMCIIDDHK